MNTKKHHKTIVLSDIHLGFKWSKAKEVTHFLKQNTCDTLILCGDIIDGWNLKRGKKSKWKKEHSDFISLLLKLQYNTKIIYIRGNHDDFLDNIIPVHFENIEIVKDYIYSSNGKRYYVLHGDVFDHITSRFSWLSKIGDVAYGALLWINNVYNKKRAQKGKTYYALSRKVKSKVKASVSYISDFGQHIASVAKENGCEAVICGHIHQAAISKYDDITYLNSGDWVESLTALTEDYNGNWEIKDYTTFIEESKSTPIRFVI